MSARAFRTRPLARLAFAASLALLSFAAAVRADTPLTPSAEHAARAELLTLGLDFDEARKELAAGDPEDPAVAIERGRLALYEEDCDGAATILARPDLAKTEQGESLADIARGCARVTAATVVDHDAATNVEIRYQDEADRALTPLLTETIVKARDALTRDLGVTWPKPTRVVVVRDLLSLSAMTGLPYESAQTTGTVAVAKWGRVTLLSPRASRHGYSWRDTVAHELTHLAVTRASQDRAPLWLQEGVAKREEVRWREPGPFDDRPPVDSVVSRGIEMKLDLALDKLGPSIAMLPSADAAMVAFAEVTSFVRFYVTSGPPDALPHLFLLLRQGKNVDEALREASGSDLKQWDGRWRAALAAEHHEALPSAFGLGTEPPNVKELRERVRLAELLASRGHLQEALVEVDHLKGKGGTKDVAADDPSLQALRGKILAQLGRPKEASAQVTDPKEVVASFAPWWALRGVLARGAGSDGGGDFVEAVAADPFDVEAACEDLTPPQGVMAPAPPGATPPPTLGEASRLLCEAARGWTTGLDPSE